MESGKTCPNCKCNLSMYGTDDSGACMNCGMVVEDQYKIMDELPAGGRTLEFARKVMNSGATGSYLSK